MSILLRKKCCCGGCKAGPCLGIDCTNCAPEGVTGRTPASIQVAVSGVVIDEGCYYCDYSPVVSYKVTGSFPDTALCMTQRPGFPCVYDFVQDSYTDLKVEVFAGSACAGTAFQTTNRLKATGQFTVNGFEVTVDLRSWDGVTESGLFGRDIYIATGRSNDPPVPPATVGASRGNVCCETVNLYVRTMDPVRCLRQQGGAVIIASNMGAIVTTPCCGEEEEI